MATFEVPDEPCVLVYVHDGVPGVPDWVRLPTALGGARINVKHGKRCACPCGDPHEVLVLVLDEPTGLCVAECRTHGYLWYREAV